MVSQARTSPVKPQPSQVVRRDKFDQVWFSWGPCSSQGRLIGSWESATRLFECSANSVGAVWMLHLTPAWCTKAILGQPRAFLRELGVVEWCWMIESQKNRKVNSLHILLAETWRKTVKTVNTVTGFPLFRYWFVLFLLSLVLNIWAFLNQVQRHTTSVRRFSVNTWETTPYPNPQWVLAPTLWQSHLSQADAHGWHPAMDMECWMYSIAIASKGATLQHFTYLLAFYHVLLFAGELMMHHRILCLRYCWNWGAQLFPTTNWLQSCEAMRCNSGPVCLNIATVLGSLPLLAEWLAWLRQLTCQHSVETQDDSWFCFPLFLSNNISCSVVIFNMSCFMVHSGCIWWCTWH